MLKIDHILDLHALVIFDIIRNEVDNKNVIFINLVFIKNKQNMLTMQKIFYIFHTVKEK